MQSALSTTSSKKGGAARQGAGAGEEWVGGRGSSNNGPVKLTWRRGVIEWAGPGRAESSRAVAALAPSTAFQFWVDSSPASLSTAQPLSTPFFSSSPSATAWPGPSSSFSCCSPPFALRLCLLAPLLPLPGCLLLTPLPFSSCLLSHSTSLSPIFPSNDVSAVCCLPKHRQRRHRERDWHGESTVPFSVDSYIPRSFLYF